LPAEAEVEEHVDEEEECFTSNQVVKNNKVGPARNTVMETPQPRVAPSGMRRPAPATTVAKSKSTLETPARASRADIGETPARAVPGTNVRASTLEPETPTQSVAQGSCLASLQKPIALLRHVIEKGGGGGGGGMFDVLLKKVMRCTSESAACGLAATTYHNLVVINVQKKVRCL
jgi:hypothetical protein